MKNVMIYTGGGWANKEDEKLARIQIDNSLDLGWNEEDILFFTDFPFKYHNISAQILPKGISYDFDKKANKIKVVSYLLENKLLEKGEVYWCHDLDVFQLVPIDIDLGHYSIAIPTYFYKEEWSLSNFFFTTKAKEFISFLANSIQYGVYKSRNNEKTFARLVHDGHIGKDEFQELNVTYHIAKRCLRTIYKEATKPLKVLHFRPSNYDKLMPDTALNMFMYGKNSLKMPLMNDKLINIFKKHGIR